MAVVISAGRYKRAAVATVCDGEQCGHRGQCQVPAQHQTPGHYTGHTAAASLTLLLCCEPTLDTTIVDIEHTNTEPIQLF